MINDRDKHLKILSELAVHLNEMEYQPRLEIQGKEFDLPETILALEFAIETIEGPEEA